MIKCEAARAREKRYKSTDMSNNMMNSDDIARRVTEQLNLKAERRNIDEIYMIHIFFIRNRFIRN